MSHKIKIKLLKKLEKINQNNIKSEQTIFQLSFNQEETERYNKLLSKERDLNNILKSLNIKEEDLYLRENNFNKKEKKLNRKWSQLDIKEKEIIKKEKDKEREKEKEKEKVAKELNDLLLKEKKLIDILKSIKIKEDNLILKENDLKNREKELSEKETKLNNKEKEIIKKEKEKEEEKKLEEKRKKLKRQKEIKDLVENTFNKPKEVGPKKLFENISKLGKAVKEEMKDELKKNPDKFVDINKTLNNPDPKFLPSAVLANNLQKDGILTFIEKDAKPSPLNDISLKFILNGVINQKKIIISYDFGPEENHKILRDSDYQQKFIDNEYEKISKLLKIQKEHFNICNFGIDSVQYELIINKNFAIKSTDPFISTDTNFEDLIKKLNKYSSSDNSKLNVKLSPMLEAMKLSTGIFDSRGNKDSGWSMNSTRGGMPYDPPIGWSGHGLKVIDKYGDNEWLGNNNNPGEWAVAYHGTNINFAKSILESKLYPGSRQQHEKCNNINKKCPNPKVGIGIYVTPKISIAEKFSTLKDNYKCIFMCRVNPIKYRTCDQDYWVVDAEDTDIRPYRLLIKKYS